MPDKTIDEALAQNLEALVKGDFGRVMSDLSPEAMMQMASQAGGGGMQMGAAFTGYQILDRKQDGDEHVFQVELQGDNPVKLEARWKVFMDMWKIASVTPLEQ